MTATGRKVRLAGGLALALALAGCGSDSPVAPPTPSPPAQPPSPSVVTQGSTALEFDAALRVPFNTSRAGTVSGEVQWTYATNALLVVLTDGACSFQQFLDQQCTMIFTSLGTSPKPRTFSLSGRAAGAYTLFIGNIGPDDESVAFQVVLAPSASAASASASSAPSVDLGTLDLRRFRPQELR